MAAVEFALILPLLLLIYFGVVEISLGIQSSRKTSLVARSLADLASQQLTCASNPVNTPCLVDADMTAIFASAAAIMSPFSATALKMTVSQIDIVSNNGNLYAYTSWSVTNNGGTARPCAGGGTTVAALSSNSSLKSLDVAPGASGYQNAMPTGFLTASSQTGSLIVSDVTFAYTSPFGFSLYNWNVSTTSNITQVQYMRTRTGTPIVGSMTTNATICTGNP